MKGCARIPLSQSPVPAPGADGVRIALHEGLVVQGVYHIT
jgi:hypothetical protein